MALAESVPGGWRAQGLGAHWCGVWHGLSSWIADFCMSLSVPLYASREGELGFLPLPFLFSLIHLYESDMKSYKKVSLASVEPMHLI